MTNSLLKPARRLLVTPLVLLLAACTFSAPLRHESPINLEKRDHELWASTVDEFLTNDLWTDRDAYDAGHLLMAPLDAAFRSGEASWQEAFAEHFERFVAVSSKTDNDVTQEKLWRLQYLYLAGRYLSKAAAAGNDNLVPPGLAPILLEELEHNWLYYDAWQWEMPSFRGMKERLEWKLSTSDVDESYYRAIIDEELFTLALAAEYRAYERQVLAAEDWSPIVSEVLEVAMSIVEVESTSYDGGWLFQSGVWYDHPDYEFAGVTMPEPGMTPTPRDNVATDSSHASRWPLWLRSFRDAYEPSSHEYQSYDNDLDLLANQFVEHVLVPASDKVPYMRMANYMDGWNGLFRWGYETTGNDGYGPYELSGSLLVIWWGMLPDARVTSEYCDLAQGFPLPEDAVSLYVGPNTTRERHPLVEWPEYFSNGFSEFNVRLMCKLGST